MAQAAAALACCADMRPNTCSAFESCTRAEAALSIRDRDSCVLDTCKGVLTAIARCEQRGKDGFWPDSVTCMAAALSQRQRRRRRNEDCSVLVRRAPVCTEGGAAPWFLQGMGYGVWLPFRTTVPAVDVGASRALLPVLQMLVTCSCCCDARYIHCQVIYGDLNGKCGDEDTAPSGCPHWGPDPPSIQQRFARARAPPAALSATLTGTRGVCSLSIAVPHCQ